MNVNEIADYEDYRNTFTWNPTKDEQIQTLDKSVLLSGISERTGATRKDLATEIDRRKTLLHWMREHNIRSYKDVAAIIAEYFARPKQVYEKVLAGEEVRPIAVSGES
jgi:hypothetical protein